MFYSLGEGGRSHALSAETVLREWIQVIFGCSWRTPIQWTPLWSLERIRDGCLCILRSYHWWFQIKRLPLLLTIPMWGETRKQKKKGVNRFWWIFTCIYLLEVRRSSSSLVLFNTLFFFTIFSWESSTSFMLFVHLVVGSHLLIYKHKPFSSKSVYSQSNYGCCCLFKY